MSAIFDILIGLFVVFLVFAVVVSGVHEWWAQFFGQRGRFLHLGMQRLIGDDALFARVIEHPLIANLYRDRPGHGKPPAYVDNANFALAFADVVQGRSGSPTDPTDTPLELASLRAALGRLRVQGSPAAIAVAPILDRAAGNLETALTGIEHWFASGMDRVSGWYKAYAQRRLFAWGLLFAILCNVDAIAIFHALNASAELRADLASRGAVIAETGRIGTADVARESTGADAKAMIDRLSTTPLAALPIGYACIGVVALATPPEDGQPAADGLRSTAVRCGDEWAKTWSFANVPRLLLHMLGCVLTALAGVLGAPYWFGLLTKVINIRGAGPKPEPKPRTG